MSRRKIRDDTSAPDPQPDPRETFEKTSDSQHLSNSSNIATPSSEKVLMWRHNYVVHKTESASPLSSNSSEQNFRGFFNLAGIVLVCFQQLAVKNSLGIESIPSKISWSCFIQKRIYFGFLN